MASTAGTVPEIASGGRIVTCSLRRCTEESGGTALSGRVSLSQVREGLIDPSRAGWHVRWALVNVLRIGCSTTRSVLISIPLRDRLLINVSLNFSWAFVFQT